MSRYLVLVLDPIDGAANHLAKQPATSKPGEGTPGGARDGMDTWTYMNDVAQIGR
jgi:hypothetical protein